MAGRASGSWRLYGRWIGRERERVFEEGFNSCDTLAQVGHIAAQLVHFGAQHCHVGAIIRGAAIEVLQGFEALVYEHLQ